MFREASCQPALQLPASADDYRAHHACMARQVVNMPTNRLVLPCMSCQSMRQIPLSAAHIKIQPGSEDEFTQAAHSDPPGAGQMEDSDVNTTIHASYRTILILIRIHFHPSTQTTPSSRQSLTARDLRLLPGGMLWAVLNVMGHASACHGQKCHSTVISLAGMKIDAKLSAVVP